MGEAYADVALTAITSVRAVGTTHDLVVLVWNLRKALVQRLSMVATSVEHISQTFPCPHNVERRGEMNKNQYLMCSKIPLLLRLTQYSRVLFLDSDVVLTENIDYLFTAALTPSTSNSSFWIAGTHNPKNAQEIAADGTPAKSAELRFNGGLMLLEPTEEAAVAFDTFLTRKRRENEVAPWTSRRADQELTSEFFESQGGIRWLGCELNWGVWNMGLRGRELAEWAERHPPKVLHFSGNFKPWLAKDELAWSHLVKDRKVRSLGRRFACVWHRFHEQAMLSIAQNPLSSLQADEVTNASLCSSK
ncbi:hypothetical protein CYMTET_41361 [Cymbomonas tetramitiformis]|uniref:Hexosyltransferase n=1 Tax=Cymbomonas tetramitiformis TaxID=36881 RepID=A0AAE0C7P2_9CHLO|nr:hypothetical protein CYMTET_41361 [Cymbomonas tetramitiformis]